MKKIIFFKSLKYLKSQPKLLKKLKLFVAVGLVSFIALGGLAIWASASAIKYVATAVNEKEIVRSTRHQIESMKSSLNQMEFHPVNCWLEAQSLLVIETWMQSSLEDNFRKIKMACLSSKSNTCQAEDCQVRDINKFKVGEMI